MSIFLDIQFGEHCPLNVCSRCKEEPPWILNLSNTSVQLIQFAKKSTDVLGTGWPFTLRTREFSGAIPPKR
ncbi:hypothetical protein Y032_0037g3493 [Ancylostoma ceylanicum]|uniref:Uncharacterized protein n=1 Tax=Ancylostoma ceylanicum TaxID=53326 RepID=A0A016UKK5_9BILA|nr:hypothetical protein Y032_0037g3493 [Ancylostoma ceylanicum]